MLTEGLFVAAQVSGTIGFAAIGAILVAAALAMMAAPPGNPGPGNVPPPPGGPAPGKPGQPMPRPGLKPGQPQPGGAVKQVPGDPNTVIVEGEESEEPEEESAVAAVAGEMAPWLISLFVHAALVILAMFIVWSAFKQTVPEEEPIIPIAKFSENPGAPLSMQTTTKISQSSSSRRTVTKEQTQTTNLTSPVKTNTSLIGVAGGSAGKANPFGTAVGTGGPFNAGFFGSGGNAKNIAYLVDASGSLVDTFPFVIVELKRSVSELNEAQAFTVIFFQGDKAIEAPPAGLKKATAQTKQRVMEWIDPFSSNIVPVGADTNPVPAIKQALKYKPQLLFMLSDNITGRQIYELNQKRLTTEVQKANVANTKINTIQFLEPDPLTRYGFKGTLELIASESGGIYKFVDARELGIDVE